MKTKSFVFITACLVGLAGSTANGDLVRGDLLGVFSGNDSESSLMAELTLDASHLSRIETPAVSSNGLTVMNLVLDDDDEPISGEWSFGGPELVDIFVVKAGNSYAVYQYTNANTNNMRNMGIWDNADIPGNAAMSHVTAYQLSRIPEPSSALVLSLVLAGVVCNRRSRSKVAIRLDA